MKDGGTMTHEPCRADINISRIPVAGIGGIGMIVVAVAMAATFPLTRWVLLLGVGGGVLLACAMILLRRR